MCRSALSEVGTEIAIEIRGRRCRRRSCRCHFTNIEPEERDVRDVARLTRRTLRGPYRSPLHQPSTSGCKARRRHRRGRHHRRLPRTSWAMSSTSSFQRSGDRVEAMKPFGVIESVKTASDLFAPVCGHDHRGQPARHDEPQLVNDAPYQDGWLIKVEAGQSERHRPIADGRAVRRAGHQLLTQS